MSNLTSEERAELDALRRLAAAVQTYLANKGAIEAAADEVRAALAAVPPPPAEGRHS
jgi:hypothetical protein